jgi:hypothetical protein
LSPTLRFTKPFTKRAGPRLLQQFSDRFDSVSKHFSEVQGEITVGLTTSYNGLALTGVKGGAAFDKLCFPPLDRKGLPTRYVIGHELMHIVQSKVEGMPSTERSCDIFTLARLPAEMLDRPPIYLRIPRGVKEQWGIPAVSKELAEAAHLAAIEAILIKPENARYIRWWEKQFAERAERIIEGR